MESTSTSPSSPTRMVKLDDNLNKELSEIGALIAVGRLSMLLEKKYELATVGEVQAGGGVALHLFHKPLILLIWIGAVITALGGGLSMTDRRLRVGVPVRARPVRAVPLAAE